MMLKCVMTERTDRDGWRREMRQIDDSDKRLQIVLDAILYCLYNGQIQAAKPLLEIGRR
jgi:hypothetical protein